MLTESTLTYCDDLTVGLGASGECTQKKEIKDISKFYIFALPEGSTITLDFMGYQWSIPRRYETKTARLRPEFEA